MGVEGAEDLEVKEMGKTAFSRFLVALIGLFLLFGLAFGQILDKDKMRALRMKHRHPNPVYLQNTLPAPELDGRERVWKGEKERWGSVWKSEGGKWIWRPDPDAQVDELKAREWEKARSEGRLEP